MLRVWILLLALMLSPGYIGAQQTTITLDPIDEQLLPERAVELLQYGMVEYSVANWVHAITAFEKAIRTGELNNAGRAFSYWHIGQAYMAMGDIDRAAEALFFFGIVGEMLLEEAYNPQFIIDSGIPDKIREARQFVEELWRMKRGIKDERVLCTGCPTRQDR